MRDGWASAEASTEGFAFATTQRSCKSSFSSGARIKSRPSASNATPAYTFRVSKTQAQISLSTAQAKGHFLLYPLSNFQVLGKLLERFNVAVRRWHNNSLWRLHTQHQYNRKNNDNDNSNKATIAITTTSVLPAVSSGINYQQATIDTVVHVVDRMKSAFPFLHNPPA